AYMRKNEKRFKAEESRVLDYVLIEEKPSETDQSEVQNSMSALLSQRVVYNAATATNDTVPGFRNAGNVAQFVNENSDIPFDSTYVAKSDLPAEHADKIFALQTGDIYGPYTRGDYYCVSKVMGKKSGAKVKASHILISYE